MKTIIRIFLFTLLVSVKISAQQTSFQDSLLDRMTGSWILTGIIAGQEVTHDLEISWILEHQYIQISEMSREKDPDGTAVYESLVHIGWDPELNKYACLWLDVTGGSGLNGKGIGHAERNGDELPFLFQMNESTFHTTFIYERNSDTWRWTMDGEKNGELNPFARVKLKRKE
jgi:hypothetical protein